jgi:hypothetical protein
VSAIDAPRQIAVQGVQYELRPGPVRQSLGEEAPTLWGFEMQVLRDGEPLGIKTCFIGRVSVHTRSPEALEGGMQDLAPVLYDLGQEKVVEQLEAGQLDDEILFA